jgi:type II secretory pathway pseudopilin PulG
MPNGNSGLFSISGFYSEQGFTYIGLLLFIAISGIALATIGQVWHTEIQREKEQELIFIGQQYSQAIGSYYQNGPVDARQYPASLQDLLVDNRTSTPRHHLRKLYRDPFTNSLDWGLIKQQGRIVGIHSQSKLMPRKRTGFSPTYEGFDQASSYAEWKFTYSALNSLALGTLPNANPPNTDGGSGTNNPSPDNKPATPAPAVKPRDIYADCAKQLDADNETCRSTCGNPEGNACRICYGNAFTSYRSCLSSQTRASSG